MIVRFIENYINQYKTITCEIRNGYSCYVLFHGLSWSFAFAVPVFGRLNVLLRMAYLVCGSRSDAEDIVQETFVKCWLHIGELKKSEGFRSWLYQIMYRTAYRQRKRSGREVPSEDAVTRADTEDALSSLDRMLWTEMQRQVWRAVSSLDFKHRSAVILYYYQEMTTGEIAAVLSCSEGTVKSRLFHARKKLEAELKPLQEGVGV